MAYCKEYYQLNQEEQNQVDVLIKKITGKANVADIDVEKSDLQGYDLKVTVCKYNSVKGWATIGY